jgi:hypothetical protein
MEPGPFENVLVALSRADVRYLVVGGVACALNGYLRTTEDVDLLIDAEEENVRRLLDVLSSIGEGYARELRVEDFTDDEGAIRLIEDFPIDLFVRMGGLRYADLLPHRRVHAGLAPIPYVDAEGLILLKENSRRPQDVLDVEALRRLSREP